MLIQRGFESERDWQYNVASDNKALCLAGRSSFFSLTFFSLAEATFIACCSYHAALQQKLTSVILKAVAVILSFVDRNNNLALLLNPSGYLRLHAVRSSPQCVLV